ncbi:MAG: hypothetical protein R3A80_03095 [Bdellovibrionota bacterium]
MKKLMNLLGTVTLAMAIASPAFGGRGGTNQGAAGGQGNGGVQAPTGVDLSWCGGRTNCVLVSLSSTPGRKGKLKLYSLNSAGTAYNTTLSDCDAIGGLDSHPDGQRAKKTPAGVHSVIDTEDNLFYNGHYLNSVHNPTYFKSFRPWSSNRMAIHSGVDTMGGNSHGCVRTTSSCASTVRRKADSDGYSQMKIKIVYF